MVAQELEGENLGQKHRVYNATLKELITTQTVPETKLEHTDINNLLKIDVACHNKDVEYILNALKSDDMLYVSRAVTRSTWLVTDKEYAHIINPEYLQSNMFPYMTIKAVTKFKKHIRHNIKDETRADQFYLNEKNESDSIKWLPYCSVQFIDSKIEHLIESQNFSPRLFKRLCEKSATFFNTIIEKINCYERNQYLHVVTFLLNTDTGKYLDALEENYSRVGYCTKLNHKHTEIVMKNDPNRVTEKIDKYIALIHLPTFVKHLTADQVKTFLYAQAEKDLDKHEFMSLRKLFRLDTLKLFIRRLPKDEQFDFVKNVCIGKGFENEADIIMLSSDTPKVRLTKLCHRHNPKPYVWYQFAPFDVAFEEITKLYPLSGNNHEKRDMLSVLMLCADLNLQNIQNILKYYNKQTKEDADGKLQLVNEVLAHTCISKYDETTWKLLNDILTSANIYEAINTSCGYTQIVNCIIIYNILKGHKVPEVIEKIFTFDTLKSYKSKMDEEQQNKLFGYLYNCLLSKIKDPITTENDLTESIETLENLLKLIRDWAKSILDFPLIQNKIREWIKLKKENSWKVSLSSLYNVNTSWRRHMFEESVALSPCEEVCLNAIKHDPQLLERHSDVVDAIKTNDSVSLRRVQQKLRLYWSYSLARQWIDTYMSNFDKATGQKAAVQGFCTMLSQKALLDTIEKYKPVKPKIDWKEIDENVLNMQRLLAKYMHYGRPQPIPDAILSYAKGDYLQFALPSVHAIFYNLKPIMNKEYIPKLLDAPASLQKHGIRFAFKKLERDEIKKIFSDCWQTSKNVSIRAIIFKYTFTLLCSEKDDAKAVSLWELLELFMDNLTLNEDKDTYQLLSQVEKVPLVVRAKFLVKSYEFLQKLVPKMGEDDPSNYRFLCSQLAEHSSQVMETISPAFVLTIIEEFVHNDFLACDPYFVRSIHHSSGIIGVISAYLLCTTNENDQLQRYEQVFVPLMQRAFEKWDEKRDGRFFIRRHFQHLLTRLTLDLKNYVTENNKIIPLKMFTLIQAELEKSLNVSENYLMLTNWKLTVALATLAEQYTSSEEKWYDNCGSEFGKICLEYLKQDVAAHFPCIYILFSKCVWNIISDLLSEATVLQCLESIISDKDYIQGYLTVIELCSNQNYNRDYKVFCNMIALHPSVEVKMHYYNKIGKPQIV